MIGVIALEALRALVRLIESADGEGKLDPYTAAEVAVEGRKLQKFGPKPAKKREP